MIVCKFGGTSVGGADAIRRVAGIVAARAAERPVVVVSALAGVTSALLELVARHDARDRAGLRRGIAALAGRHLDVAAGLELPAAETRDLSNDLDRLRLMLIARPPGPLSRADRERVAGLGEYLSARLVAAALARVGLSPAPVDARRVIVTTPSAGGARPRRRPIAALAAGRLGPLVARGRVPVTQGFVGATSQGRPTTLGRGGSDLTAALLGAALGARRVEIWTDVDGIHTADPRLVPGARLLPELTPAEARRLARAGARVLHPATLDPLLGTGIPLRVRNTFAPEAGGTLIREPEPNAGTDPVRAVVGRLETDASGRDRARITVLGIDHRDRAGLERLFEALRDLNIEVSLGRPEPGAVTFQVPAGVAGDASRRLHQAVVEREEPIECPSFPTSPRISRPSTSGCGAAS